MNRLKKYFFISMLVLINSCNESKDNIMPFYNGGFVKAEGTYKVPKYNLKLVETKSGLLFGISDKKNKLLYQSDIFKAFSQHAFWSLYIDEDFNVWVYNSDYQETVVLFFDEQKMKFSTKDYCKDKLNLPKEFKKSLNDRLVCQ